MATGGQLAGFEEDLLRDHPSNGRRASLLLGVRSGLEGAAPGAGRDAALRELDALEPHSPLSSWMRLRDRLGRVDPSLAMAIEAECALVHLSVLASARYGDDLVPVAHSICAKFMEACKSCAASWEGALRDISARLDPSASPPEAFCRHAANFLRFGGETEAGMFASMVRELCVMRGHYAAACDACEIALGFGLEDAQAALAATGIEDVVACVADRAGASGQGDPQAIARCAGILEERSRMLGLGEIRVARDPRAVGAAARRITAARMPERGSEWGSIPVVYPLELKFEEQMEEIRRPIPARLEWLEAMDILELATTLLLGAVSRNVVTLHEELKSTMLYVGRNVSFGARMGDYILDSARFGSGAGTSVPFYLLRTLYSERGLHRDALDVCGRIARLEGPDAQRMAASMLIEQIVGGILAGARRGSRADFEGIAEGCLDLLNRRSESLGLGLERRKYAGDTVRRAAALAHDISARRRMYGVKRLEMYIREKYPLSHEFLNVGEDMRHMVEKYSDIAFHVSNQVHIQEIADASREHYYPNGALEELESTLAFLRSRKIRIHDTPNEWRHGMKNLQLWGMLFEMGVYAHLVAHVGGVVPHPKISDGRRADFEAAGCHIEAYSPLDTLVGAPGGIIKDPRAEQNLCCSVMDKPQIDHFGHRRSILAVEFQALDFRSESLQDLLRERLRRRAQLGGILMACRAGPCYWTHFLENRGASHPPDADAVRRIRAALETPLAGASPQDQT